jgi:flavin-binding protein dodecin
MLDLVSVAARMPRWARNPRTARPRDPAGRPQMNDHVYSITEIIGTSKTSVEDAVQQGVKTAAKTLRNLEWFEVTQIKGHIVDGGVGHYQVSMKLGLRYDKK